MLFVIGLWKLTVLSIYGTSLLRQVAAEGFRSHRRLVAIVLGIVDQNECMKLGGESGVNQIPGYGGFLRAWYLEFFLPWTLNRKMAVLLSLKEENRPRPVQNPCQLLGRVVINHIGKLISGAYPEESCSH